MYDLLESRAIIKYHITTKSDLHIGGHGSTAEGAVDSPALKNSDGKPVIPGSSLKGVLRTDLERLLKGLKINDICTVPVVCGKPGTLNENKICPVCELFGGMNLAGSVRIHDAVATGKNTAIREHVAIDRKTRKAKDGAKFDLEAVVKGTKFEGDLVIENLDLGTCPQAKLGGFLSLVEFFNTCSGKIGGAGSRGYGQIEITIDEIRIVKAQDYLDGIYKGVVVTDRKAAIDNWQKYLKSLPHTRNDGGSSVPV